MWSISCVFRLKFLSRIRTARKANGKPPQNSKRVAIFFQASDPLPAILWNERVSLGALKMSDREGTSEEIMKTLTAKWSDPRMNLVDVKVANE